MPVMALSDCSEMTEPGASRSVTIASSISL